jgi:hypothetical protein
LHSGGGLNSDDGVFSMDWMLVHHIVYSSRNDNEIFFLSSRLTIYGRSNNAGDRIRSNI